eukprot:TRINITY_DN61071_c0_g1_i1.p1 TRINITY_DN61071_c0_g1~~TRINITY_DN61071_c0_g1_i1.p1  ORF type:complete len:433 (-),score=71.61 TRINITY_DN61071_c0_g1_i1:65-1363(-)
MRSCSGHFRLISYTRHCSLLDELPSQCFARCFGLGSVRFAAKLVDKGEGLQFSRHLVDVRRVNVAGGHGGDGACVFSKHAKHKLVGPGYPCGGHGGKGGDVIVKATHSHFSLAHLSGAVQAQHGDTGKKKRVNGTSGRDAIIHVPRGVIVRELLPSEEAELAMTEALAAGERPPPTKSWRHGKFLADLDGVGDHVVVALGGRGGKGNNMATPYDASLGSPGEKLHIELELKTIADVGLIGMPNAGKSSLLGAASRACPKIAPYPFTTVAPYVGRAEFNDGSAITIADVPGLVEGAHQGDGLGIEFLRHLERTKMLLYVVDAAHSSDPLAHFLTLRAEVAAFSPAMALKPCGVVANKCDLSPSETLSKVDVLFRAIYGRGGNGGDELDRNPPVFVRALSARLGDGMIGLLQEVRLLLQGRHKTWKPNPLYDEE